MKTLTEKLNESFNINENKSKITDKVNKIINICEPIFNMLKKEYKHIKNAKQDLFDISMKTLNRYSLDNDVLHDIIEEWAEYLSDNEEDLSKELYKSIIDVSKKLSYKTTYNNFNELKKLKSDGIKYVNLNGFQESIGYVINLKLDDDDLVKIDDLSYETTY